MALSASEKERIMQARGESSLFAQGSTIIHHPVVDGKPVTMVSISGLSKTQAADYCRGIFGKRFSGFKKGG